VGVPWKRIRTAVNCGFKNHLVARVPRLRTPLKMNFDRLDQCGQLRQKFVNYLGRQSVGPLMLGALQYILVLLGGWRQRSPL